MTIMFSLICIFGLFCGLSRSTKFSSVDLQALGRHCLSKGTKSDCNDALSYFHEALEQMELQSVISNANTYVYLVEAMYCAATEPSSFGSIYGRMKDLITTTNLTAAILPKFYYSLSNVAETLADYNASYAYIVQANQVMKGKIHSFDTHLFSSEMELAQTISTLPILFQVSLTRQKVSSPSSSKSGKGLIFLVGLPHSGIEYVERTLVAASHGTIFSLNNDLQYYQAVANKIDHRVQEGFVGSYAGQLERELATLLFSQATNGNDLTHIDWFKVLETLEKHGTSVEHNMHAVREYAVHVLAKEKGRTVETAPRYVIDSEGANFLHLGLIHLMFPLATIIHVHRNPIANLWDIYRQLGNLHESSTAKFTHGHTHTTRLNWALDWTDLLKYYSMYQQSMEHWTAVLPTGYITSVSYESWISASELSGLGQAKKQGHTQKGVKEILKKLEIVDRQKKKGTTKGGKDISITEASHILTAVLDTSEQWRKYESLLPNEVLQFEKAWYAKQDHDDHSEL